MLFAPLRWLGRNLSTLLLAFILAVVVWVSAVVTADPNEVSTFRPVAIEVIGQDSGLLLINEIPNQARLTLRAPRSIWNQLNNNPNLARTWVDLTGLGAGEHTVRVKAQVNLNPVRFVQIDPSEVHVTLEALVTRTLALQLAVTGEPALGYRKGAPQYQPAVVSISGPASAVTRVAELRLPLDVAGASETVRASVAVEAIDANGDIVPNVTITPRMVNITQPINLLGGYKNVVVKVVTVGQPANGYRLTNISVTPLNVTVFSANPQLVDEIPGYVETDELNINGLSDDVDIRAELNLPEGVSLVGEQSVLVQVGIAAIEGSLTFSLPIETLGLPPELAALVSPPLVDVIVSGPLPILETLTLDSFRVVVDLAGLGAGVYQAIPIVDLVPDQVQVDTIQPGTVEVTVTDAPTPTPTSPASLTPIPTRTPTPDVALTPTVTSEP